VARAARLHKGGAARDVVDQVIGWQLAGDAKIGCVREPGGLHLPELYSGRSPTASGGDRWVMFVGPSPNIDVREDYPTDGSLEQHGVDALKAFFENRFARTPPIGGPHAYGRSDDRDLAEVGGLCVHLRDGRRGPPPPTWSRIESLLVEIRCDRADRPLGTVAMFADAVPWKFARWASIGREMQGLLLEAGRPLYPSGVTRC